MERFPLVVRRLGAALLVFACSAAVPTRASAGPVYLKLDSLGAGLTMKLYYNTGSPAVPGDPVYNPVTAFVGQLHASLYSTSGTTQPIGSIFNTFCVDLNHEVSVGQEYKVNIAPTSTLLPNGDKVEYIYQKYGEAKITSNNMGAAVQLAIWDELANNGQGPTSTSMLQYTASTAVTNLVNQILTDANTHSASWRWLDASASGTSLTRGQSFLDPTPEPSSLTLLGFGFCGLGGRLWMKRRRKA